MTLKRALTLACLLTSASAPAVAELLAPDHAVNGIPQAQLSGRWWQWLSSYPIATNPGLDTTGEHSNLGSDQGPVSHPGIFFLAGNFSGFSARTVTLTDDQSLFVPLV